METNWYYTLAGQQQGPISFEALRQLILNGQVQPQELAWCDGMRDWRPIYTIPEFATTPAAQPQPSVPLAAPMVPYSSYVAMPPSPHVGKAVTAFVLSLVGLFCCGIIFGPVAIILAVNVQNEMRQSGDMRGQGYATAGFVIGLIATILNVGGFLIAFLGH